MKRFTYLTFCQYILVIIVLTTGCKKDEDPIVVPIVIPEADVVNKFIWTGMHDYYLWNSQIPNLTNEKFDNTDSLNFFLNKYTDHQKLFVDLLYKYEKVDKWSFLVEDAKEIDDWISGTSKTMGYDFRLVQLDEAGNLLGYVRYVFKNSPAELAGLKRGDIFMTINDQQLTISNYETLLFETETYKIGFAEIGDSFTPGNRSLTMTAVEMQENPINKDTIFTYANQKIGYLVYNGFTSDFDIQLNEVIKKFKDAAIDQMILDLRYNGGGSVYSSIYLASMVYGTDNNKLFAKAHYNSIIQEYLLEEDGPSAFNNNFTNLIDGTLTTPATPIVTLNLQKIYIIASDNTASASELLINGLRPYMNVKVVGTNTYGKYTGSMTVRDYDEKGVISKKHNYAMQPIIVKYANSQGVTDYVDGLNPDIKASEISERGITYDDLVSILPFGDPNERLLSVVLADISGIPPTAMTQKSAQTRFKNVASSRDFKPFANEMYIKPFNHHIPSKGKKP